MAIAKIGLGKVDLKITAGYEEVVDISSGETRYEHTMDALFGTAMFMTGSAMATMRANKKLAPEDRISGPKMFVPIGS